MSYVWLENTYSAENKMKNLLLCHDEKCNNTGHLLWIEDLSILFSFSMVIGATTLPVTVSQVILHSGVCFGSHSLMLC